MLVLTRKIEEQIRIGDNVTISILRVKGNTVRVGIEAPREVRVVRGELPTHGQVDAPSSSQATHDVSQATIEVVVPDVPQADGRTMPDDEVEFTEPATTAVRQFLANRARRQNRRPKCHRPVDKAVAAAMTRSA